MKVALDEPKDSLIWTIMRQVFLSFKKYRNNAENCFRCHCHQICICNNPGMCPKKSVNFKTNLSSKGRRMKKEVRKLSWRIATLSE